MEIPELEHLHNTLTQKPLEEFKVVAHKLGLELVETFNRFNENCLTLAIKNNNNLMVEYLLSIGANPLLYLRYRDLNSTFNGSTYIVFDTILLVDNSINNNKVVELLLNNIKNRSYHDSYQFFLHRTLDNIIKSKTMRNSKKTDLISIIVTELTGFIYRSKYKSINSNPDAKSYPYPSLLLWLTIQSGLFNYEASTLADILLRKKYEYELHDMNIIIQISNNDINFKNNFLNNLYNINSNLLQYLINSITTVLNVLHHNLLYTAVMKLDTVFIDKLLILKVDPNKLSSNGDTCLHAITTLYNTDNSEKIQDIIIKLIKYGANPNSTDMFGKTVLHYACDISLKLVDILINNRANIVKYDKDNKTPLHYACSSTKFSGYGGYNNKKIVELLINYHVPVNIKDTEWNTPLHYACKYNNIGLLPILLNAHADPNIKNKDNITPLHIACTTSVNMVQKLINKSADPNIKDTHNMTPLHYACQYLPTAVNYLLKHGADPNVRDKKGVTPLLYICKYSPEILDLFLNSRIVNHNIVDYAGQSALHYACIYSPSIIPTLLRIGLNPNIKDKYGLTPTHYACWCVPPSIFCCTLTNTAIYYLLENKHIKINLNIQDKNGDTPMHYACTWIPSMVNLLVIHGGKLDILNKDKITPQDNLVKICSSTCSDISNDIDTTIEIL